MRYPPLDLQIAAVAAGTGFVLGYLVHALAPVPAVIAWLRSLS